ncbi:MAG: ABC transporter permease [Deltaproteobacteria bacterium]|nr:ABC transporter permease [Deltaproteobacteria bacterium]
MNFKRLWAIFRARNHEFFRDRAAFGWNFVFPFLIVGGFILMFGGDARNQYKVGIFPVKSETFSVAAADIPARFKETRYLQFIGFESEPEALKKLNHHKIDFLVKAGSPKNEYWVSETSPKGYIVEQLFTKSLVPAHLEPQAKRRKIRGFEIRYVDWLFPGILAMNMMFSALYGVGYTVVRYRKNGVLKRLKATPLSAVEYLSAQMLSRIFLLMFTTVIVWTGCDLVFSFRTVGSYFNIFVIFFLGSLSLTSLGLIIASRGTSEEFSSGILNFISWPMMFLSEVWFSLEGAPAWIKTVSQVFPLTHMLTATRKVMNDGASLTDVSYELSAMMIMTAVCLVIGASLFSWTR